MNHGRQIRSIKKLLEKHEPVNRVSHSGDKSEEYDVYWIYLFQYKDFATIDSNPNKKHEPQLSRSLIVEEVVDNQLVCRELKDSPKDPSSEHLITQDELGDYQLEIKHYYRWLAFSYKSATKALWHRKLGIRTLLIFKEDFGRTLYDKTFRPTRDQLNVLQTVANQQTTHPEGVSITQLLTTIYGWNFWALGQIKRETAQKNLNQICQALEARGALRNNGMHYQVTKEGFGDVLRWQEEKRKSASERFHRILIVVLTSILAASSSAQALIAWSNTS